MFVIVNPLTSEVLGPFETRQAARAYWNAWDWQGGSLISPFMAEVKEPLPVHGLENK